MWPGNSSAARSSSIGPRFFPCVIMYVGFMVYMLMDIKICDLYTFTKPSHSRVFKLANVRNDRNCHRPVYD